MLYVALTRARSKIYLAWGDAGDGRASGRPMHSALAWLLHSRQTAQDLDQEEPRGFDDAATLYDELDDFAAGNKNLEVVDLPEGLSKPVDRVLRQKESIAVREFSRASLGGWHIGSFSGLTRDVHQVALTGDRFGQSLVPSQTNHQIPRVLARSGRLVRVNRTHFEVDAELLQEFASTGRSRGQSQERCWRPCVHCRRLARFDRPTQG